MGILNFLIGLDRRQKAGLIDAAMTVLSVYLAIALRHSVRPGITGLAQASGWPNMDFETRTEYDLEYARKASLFADLRIIVKTVLVLEKEGWTTAKGRMVPVQSKRMLPP